MTMTYAQRMAEAAEARKAHEAKREEFANQQRELAPRDHIHYPLGFKLSASKRFYWSPLNCLPLTSPPSSMAITHFLVIHQCGKNLAHTKHEISVWRLEPDEFGNVPKIVGDIIESTPLLHGLTVPFIFHDDKAALEASRQWVATNLDKYYTFNDETLEWELN